MKGLKTSVITAIAVGLLAGSAVGVAAQEAEVDWAAPDAFKGQFGCSEEIGPAARFEHGDVASLARPPAQATSDADDPRLDGVITWTNTRSTWGPKPGSPLLEGVPMNGELVTNVGTVRIETADGAWQGGSIFATVGKEGFLRGPLVLVGEGDYEGLTMVMDDNFKQLKNSECGAWQFRGFIIEGGLPPAPEAAAAVPPAE